MTLHDLRLRARALLARRRVERELDEEFAFHLERETERQIAAGLSRAEAHRLAQARFGSRTAVADACRDERGTMGLESVVRDVAYACRSWRRAPLAAVTIILTVAFGLGLVTIAFTFYSALALRTDAVPHPDELFELYRPPSPGVDAAVPFTVADYRTFRRTNTVFRDVAAATGGVDVRVDGRNASSMFVSGDFFRMVAVSAARGRTLSPTDDQLGSPPVIVLSDGGWAKWFVRDPAAVGATARVNGMVVQIVGVMPKGFRGLESGAPDFWMPLAAAALVQGTDPARSDERQVAIIGRLRAGLSRDDAAMGVRQWAAGRGFKLVDGRPLRVTLRPRTGVLLDTWLEMLAFAVPLFFVFGLILLIACANVASLLLARGVARQQEMGARLSLGATRGRLVRQLLTEGLVLGAAAAALAYPISRVLIACVMSVVLRSIPPEFAEQINFGLPDADWRVLPFLVAGAVAATTMFGLMPALQATRLDPMRSLRGEVLGDVRPGRMRNALMVLQVGASTLLLLCAAIFLRGVFVTARADAGVRVADTVVVSIGSESKRAAVLAALAADPTVTMNAVTSAPDRRSMPVRAVDTGIVASHTYQFVSSNYFTLLDIDILRGREFSPSERSLASGVVIVSAQVAQQLWRGLNPLGRRLRMAMKPLAEQTQATDASPDAERTFTVVGVSRDPPRLWAGLAGADADLYLPATLTTPGTRLMLRVNEDPYRARTHLLDRLLRVDPTLASVRTMRAVFRGPETILRVAFIVAVVLGGLALLLTLSGLFSVLSFLVQQRTKEIGVRMALGASTGVMARMVLKESARPVLLGAAGGVLLAGGAAGALMATPVAGAIGTMVNVLDPVAYVATLLVIMAACALAAAAPALRAARVDLMITLRCE